MVASLLIHDSTNTDLTDSTTSEMHIKCVRDLPIDGCPVVCGKSANVWVSSCVCSRVCVLGEPGGLGDVNTFSMDGFQPGPLNTHIRSLRMLLSVKELSEYLDVPIPRLNNLLNMAGLIDKVRKPHLHWEINPEGNRWFYNNKWSDEIIPMLEDQIDKQEERSSVRLTQVDTQICGRCHKTKPYYDFYYSNKRPGDLTRWCKECLQ